MWILFRLVDDIQSEKKGKKTDDGDAQLIAVLLQCDAFKTLLGVMSKSGIDAGVWAQTYDSESQRMLLNDEIKSLPWPLWMRQHRMEENVRASQDHL